MRENAFLSVVRVRGDPTYTRGRNERRALLTAPTRILLVDDDAFAHKFLQALVDELPGSLALKGAQTFDDGLRDIQAGDVDVCFVDYQLGDKSGLDFLTEVKARRVQVPVIFLTGQGDPAVDREAMRLGAADYLEKGTFDAKFLERVVRYALERSRTLAKLKDSEERYSLAVNGASDGIWDWRLGTEEIFFSPRWKQILGYDEVLLENRTETWFGRVHENDIARVRHEIELHQSGRSHHFESEHRLLHRDGSYRWVLVRGSAVRDDKGVAQRLAGSMSDVTASRSRDPLSGLPNRILFMDRLERALARTRRNESHSFAVLAVDLDRFKNINDSLGHTQGDELLVSVARRLETCVRGSDTVARIGGDEFVMLIEGNREPDGAIRVAQRTLDALSKPFLLEGKELVCGASIGIAVHRSHYRRPEEVVRDADTAMYRAKAAGRGRYVVFDQGMHDRAVAFVQLESELRRAIDGNELEVHFQPVMSVVQRRILGFEALVRWRHPQKGLIPPDRFIPIAEETGLIVPLDRWMVKTACVQMAQWHNAQKFEKPPYIAVNTSKREFDEPDFADFILRTLDETGLRPSCLAIEVTESSVIDNASPAQAMLQRLRDRGVQIVMDDFGTGYSSLSYLQRLPFTGLKVDRSFVNRIEQANASLEVVRAIITLGRSLGLSVTAEGVETEGQLAQLAVLLCDQAQGYLFSKPVPADAATKMLLA